MYGFWRATAWRVRIRTARAIITAVALTSCPSPAAQPADIWPARPLRIVVPAVAGGGVDAVARVTAQRLSMAMGQQVIVDNRPGARGTIGVDAVAKATPDGHTLLVVSESLTIMPFFERSLSFDPRKSFAAIGMLATQPLVLAVHPSVPAHNLNELVILGRSKPGALSYGSGGPGQHLTGEVVKKAAAFEMTHIPYKGGAQAVLDLVAGQLQVAILGQAPLLPFVRSGKVRVLVITSNRPSAALPNVPTAAEAGLSGVDLAQWVFMLAPAKVRPEIATRLNGDIVQALQAQEAVERLAASGFEAAPGTPRALDAMIRETMARWSKLIPELNIRPE